MRKHVLYLLKAKGENQMLGSQLFIHKDTGKVVKQIPLMDISNYSELVCDTCGKKIKSGQGCVDDGIKENVFHHMNCY